MKKDLNIKKRIQRPDHKDQNKSIRSLSSSLKIIPTITEILNTTTDFVLPKPETQNLAVTFSTPNITQDIQYDMTVYKILPSLKKKLLPSTYLSVKYANEGLINNLNRIAKPKAKKKILSIEENPQKNIFFSENPEKNENFEEKKFEEEFENSKKEMHKKGFSLDLCDPVIDKLSPRSLLESKKNNESKTIGYSKWYLANGSFI